MTVGGVKRAFVQYPGLRSTTKKYDPCHADHLGKMKEPMEGLACEECRVFLMSDRFLGDEFQRSVMGSRQKYAYCLIADTWECNFRCWFCYSHHYWSESLEKHGGKIQRIFLSPDNLATQFLCKIRQMQRIVSIKERNKPLSMLRISGGEPLYATPTNQTPPLRAVDYNEGIDFWIAFFKRLNHGVSDLIQDRELHFATTSQWRTFPTDEYFPVALQDFLVDDGTPAFSEGSPRLIIRFDTNGLAFSDHNIAGNGGSGRDFAERFVGSLYDLHRSGNMHSLCIRLTLSFKGSTPQEFYWTKSEVDCPVSPENNNKEFNQNDHPQHSSYVNLDQSIKGLIKSDPGFAECLYLNPERGVMHQLDNNVWIFYEGAVDWDNFSRVTRIPLSPVRNDFSLVTDKSLSSMLWRYVKKGAVVTAAYSDKGQTESCTVKDCLSYPETKDAIQMFNRFYKDNRRKSGFKIVIYPAYSAGTELPVGGQ